MRISEDTGQGRRVKEGCTRTHRVAQAGLGKWMEGFPESPGLCLVVGMTGPRRTGGMKVQRLQQSRSQQRQNVAGAFSQCLAGGRIHMPPPVQQGAVTPPLTSSRCLLSPASSVSPLLWPPLSAFSTHRQSHQLPSYFFPAFPWQMSLSVLLASASMFLPMLSPQSVFYPHLSTEVALMRSTRFSVLPTARAIHSPTSFPLDVSMAFSQIIIASLLKCSFLGFHNVAPSCFLTPLSYSLCNTSFFLISLVRSFLPWTFAILSIKSRV